MFARDFGGIGEVAARLDPQGNEVWEHVDGGSVYVLRRRGGMVQIQRRPFGDSLASPVVISLKTFTKQVTGRLK